MDDVFRALADPRRRQLLDSLNARNGQTLRSLCADLAWPVSRSASTSRSSRPPAWWSSSASGREKLHYLNAAPINEIAERWINRYDQRRSTRWPISSEHWSFRHEHTDDRRACVRVPDLHPHDPRAAVACADRAAFTERYWGGLALDTDWKVGSPISWRFGGVTIDDPEQVVVESDPYRRLAYSWHTFTPEWAVASGIDEALARRSPTRGVRCDVRDRRRR